MIEILKLYEKMVILVIKWKNLILKISSKIMDCKNHLPTIFTLPSVHKMRDVDGLHLQLWWEQSFIFPYICQNLLMAKTAAVNLDGEGKQVHSGQIGAI